MKPELKFYVEHEDAVIPEYKTDEAACFDLNVAFDKIKWKPVHSPEGEYLESETTCFLLNEGEACMVGTGLYADIPKGYKLNLHVRSSTGKKNLRLSNCVGIIDSDYVDEIKALLINDTSDKVEISSGKNILQAELVPIVQADIGELTEKPKKKGNREGGIGSTDK